MQCVCVCVCRSVFVGLMEVSNHPGLMETQLWQSTLNTSQEFSVWITRKDEREEKEELRKTPSKAAGEIFLAPSAIL